MLSAGFIIQHGQAKGLSFGGELTGVGGCIPATTDSATPEVEPGSVVAVKVNGRISHFAYVKAGATLALGQIVSSYLNKDDADVDAAVATTDEPSLTGTADFTANEFPGQAAWAVINANGGLKMGGKVIMRNTANVLTLDEKWDEALTTASDYLTHELNTVVLADTDAVATKHVVGVAIGVITSGQYGWIQVSGVCRKVRSVGTTDPAVIGEYVMPSSTGGACKGWTDGGTAAEDVAFSFGIALCSDAEADAAGEGIPVLLTDCLKFWM